MKFDIMKRNWATRKNIPLNNFKIPKYNLSENENFIKNKTNLLINKTINDNNNNNNNNNNKFNLDLFTNHLIKFKLKIQNDNDNDNNNNENDNNNNENNENLPFIPNKNFRSIDVQTDFN